MARLSSIKQSLNKILIFFIVANIMLWPASSFEEADAQVSQSIFNSYGSDAGEFGRIVPIGYELKQKEEKISLNAGPTPGCCANFYVGVGAEMQYCSDTNKVNQSECCDLPQYGNMWGTIGYPVSQVDCNANYWNTTCAGLGDKCAVGCCRDIRQANELQQCQPYTQEKCAAVTGSRSYWEEGYLESPGNPCYNLLGIGYGFTGISFTCPSEIECSDFNNNQTNCTSHGCVYCGTGPTTGTCISSCDGCSGKPNVNESGVCVATPVIPINCETLNSTACPASGCAWCSSGTARCLDNCTSCTNFPYLINGICTSTNPQCNDTLDNDNDAFDTNGGGFDWNGIQGSDSDFCCWGANDNKEDGSCRCGVDSAKDPNGESAAYCGNISGYTGAARCTDRRGTVINTARFNASDSNGRACCSRQCFTIPQCKQDIQVKLNNLSTLIFLGTGQGYEANYSSTLCDCKGIVLNYTDWMNASTGSYCCAAGLSPNPCITATITGFIKDNSTTPQPLIGATINAVDTADGSVYSTQSLGNLGASNGFYSRQVLPNKEYNVTASMPGYKSNSTIIPSSEMAQYATVRRDFTLSPLGMCGIEWGEPNLEQSNTTACEKAIDLKWSYVCDDNVQKYTVYRLNESGGINKTYDAGTYTNQTDNNVDWDTSYTYYLNATIDNGTIFYVASDRITASPGDSVCGDPPGDIPCRYNTNFCNESVRYTCDEWNRLNFREDCSANGDAICLQSESDAWCQDTGDPCEMTGIDNGNILGMFYYVFKDQCLANTSVAPPQQRYCYYEYSNTTVDVCAKCLGQNMFCYDYKSETACNENNCNAGQRFNCTWYDGPYAELGKGVCYAPGYAQSDYCHLCNQSNSLFENTQCEPELCDKLGACYSDPTQSNCLSCISPSVYSYGFGPTSCEDYGTNEMACTGNSSGNGVQFSINKIGSCKSADPENFTYSNDACGAGICIFKYSHCVKDGNSNNAQDCTDDACQRDTKAPVTEISYSSNQINQDGLLINFTVTDYGAHGNATYYCMDTVGDCCPEHDVNGMALTINNDLLISESIDADNYEGPVYLRYFSIDSSSNVEPIKTAEFTADTGKPDIIVTYTPVPASANTSNLTIMVTVDKNVSCSDSLIGRYYGNKGSRLTNTKLIANQDATVTFSSLEDDLYDYTVTCTDDSGNTGSYTALIEIDLLKKIIGTYPSGQLFGVGQVPQFRLNTTDMYNCYYLYGTEQHSFTNTGMAGAIYTYTASPPTSSTSGLNNYEVICNNLTGGFIDRSYIYYTYDDVAPNTTLQYLSGTYTYSEFVGGAAYDGGATGLKLRWVCNDSNLGENTTNFGCRRMTYCISDGPCQPNITIQGSQSQQIPVNYPESEYPYHIYYYSEDNGNNTEATQQKLFYVDKTAPQVNVTSQSGYIVNSAILPLQIQWNDSSAEVTINAEWMNYTSQQLKYNSTPTSNKNIIMLLNSLDAGNNSIKVTVRDRALPAVHTTTKWINVYYDMMGPAITDMQPNGIVEYGPGNNIQFSADVVDIPSSGIVAGVEVSVNCIGINGSGCVMPPSALYMGIPLNNTDGNEWAATFNQTESELLEIGNYTATFTATDSLGNRNSSSVNFTVMDTTPPLFNITIYNSDWSVIPAYDGKLRIRGDRTYMLNITSNEDISQIGYLNYTFSTLKDSVLTGPTPSGRSSAGVLTTTENMYKSLPETPADGILARFILNATDLRGVHSGDNQIIYVNNISGRAFYIDTIAPKFYLKMLHTEYSNGAARAGERINITIETSEKLKQNATVILTDPQGRSAQADYLTNVSDWSVYTYTVGTGPNAPEGAITITISGEDLAGNPGSSVMPPELFIDRTPPRFDALASFLPRNGSIINDRKPLVFALFRDYESGIWDAELWKGSIGGTRLYEMGFFNLTEHSLSYKPTNIAFIDQTATNTTDVNLFAKIYDRANNTNETGWSFTIDLNVPNTPLFSIVGGINSGNRWYINKTTPVLMLNFSENVTAGSVSYSLDPAPTTQYLTALDNKTFRIDVTSLAGTIEYELELEAARPGHSVYGKWFFNFIVDTTRPGLNVTADPWLIGLNNFTILNITYNDAYMSRIELSGAGYNKVFNEYELSHNPFRYRLDIIEDGVYPVTITAYDKAGNSNQKNITIIRDTDVPEINITAITSASGGLVRSSSETSYRTNSDRVNINGIVSINASNGLSVQGTPVELYVGGSYIGNYNITASGSSGSFTFSNIDLLTNTINSVRIVATNQQNLVSGSKELAIQHTNIGPTASLVNNVVNTTTPLLWFTTDMPSISCDISTSTGLQAALNKNTSRSFNITIPQSNKFSENSYNDMNVTCTDEDLGTAKTTQLSAYVDKAPPVISNVEVVAVNKNLQADGSYLVWQLEDVSLKATATDTPTNKIRCRYSYGSGSTLFNANYATGQQTSGELMFLNDKTNYTISITCEDIFGQVSAPRTLYLIVDTEVGLQVIIISPDDGANITGAPQFKGQVVLVSQDEEITSARLVLMRPDEEAADINIDISSYMNKSSYGIFFDTGDDIYLNDSTYTFYVEVTSNGNQGNHGRSAERSFRVDNSGPGGCILIDKNGLCPGMESCTDTDGGSVYGVKGTVMGYDMPTGQYVIVEDSCEGPDTLNEYICDGIYGVETEVSCPNGCLSGACKP